MMEKLFKKAVYLLLVFLVQPLTTNAQQTNNWYFGSPAHHFPSGLRIDFSSGSPVVSVGYPLMTQEGSSSISDDNGVPLFYTDGTDIWDASTNTKFNTFSLGGGSSSTQSAIVMPKPGVTNEWLVFTSAETGGSGIKYVTVRRTGSVYSIVEAAPVALASGVGEGLFVIGSTKSGSSFWVIARDGGNTGVVRAWEVTNTGTVVTPAVTSVMTGGAGFTNTNYSEKIGTIKANTCQNKLAFTYLNTDVDIVDFDTDNGIVVAGTAKRITVSSGGSGSNWGSYGIEFSPNDEYLYITNLAGKILYRYTIATDANASYSTITTGEAGQLQLGPDGNIYMAITGSGGSTGYLGVITNPGLAGASFDQNGLLLTDKTVNTVTGGVVHGFSFRGLPTFPKSLVVNTPELSPGDGTYCVGATIPLSYLFGGFEDPSTISWTVTSGTGQTFAPGGASSTDPAPSISFSTTGTKTVQLSFEDACGRVYTAAMTFTIVNPSVPSGALTCNGSEIILDNSGTDPNEPKYVWYANSVSATNIIGVGTPVSFQMGGNSSKPSQICVAVANTASVSTASNKSIAAAHVMNGAANGSPYVSNNIDVLAERILLKSFNVKFYTCPGASINVTIKNGGGTTIYNENVPISGCVVGAMHTIPVNVTLPAGNSYTITLNGGQFYRGSWGGATNAGELRYNPEVSAGVTSIGNIVYDAYDFTVTAGCTTPQCYPVGCALPVELIGLEGIQEPGFIRLRWSTSWEVNNDYFLIQRSVDGETFEVIGQVDGQGNYTGTTPYTYFDYTPEDGINYYRLAQTDFDGRISYSNVISVTVDGTELKALPNPSSHSFTVNVPRSSSEGRIIVRDLLGREVERWDFTSEISELTVGENLAPGTYYINFISESLTEIIKVLKQ